VRVRERDREFACVRECECVYERKIEKERVCVREREGVYVCVCVLSKHIFVCIKLDSLITQL